MLAQKSNGQSGGLIVFWQNGLQIKGGRGWCSRYHIDMEIKEWDGFEWRFTGLYGESKMDEKEVMWRLLRTLKNHSDKPWLMAEDFNETLFQCEEGQPEKFY